MDPIAIAETIFAVTKAIHDQVELVNCNQSQCQRLAERVSIMNASIARLVENASSSTPLPQSYGRALLAFKATLDEALALMMRFSDKSWMRKFIRAQSHEGKFKEIYQQLEENIQQLNLGLNVKQVLQREDDINDQKADYQRLMAQQADIIKETQAAKETMQQLKLDETNRHDVLAKQIASIQYALVQLAPEKRVSKKGEISAKLRVPFFDLSIDTLLAEGSFGKVYLGRYLEQAVAIKLLERELTPEEDKEFKREVNIMQHLRSDYIVPLYAICDEPGRACLVMKYMAQGSLRKVLNTTYSTLTPTQRHNLAIEVALGVYYLHNQGILHRDLKSENVLIDAEGKARLTDFGLSKTKSSLVSSINKQTKALAWMPPEVILDDGSSAAFTVEGDIYSFGMVLWEIMTGKTPYAGCSDMQVLSKIQKGERETMPEAIPDVYRNLINACWRQRRFERPAMSDVIQTLRAYEPPEPKPVIESKREEILASSVGSSSSFWSSENIIKQTKLPEADIELLYEMACSAERSKQYRQATVCYTQAIAHGHVKAKTGLAVLHLQKRIEGADKAVAHGLLLDAAKAGHGRAMQNVARQFEKGDGVESDIRQACHWYRKAGETTGDKKAMDKYKTLTASLASQYEGLDSDVITSL